MKLLIVIRRACVLIMLGMLVSGHASAGEYKISGPYSHKNLSIYLIHGKDSIKQQAFLTLGEAMQEKKVRVYETGNVNRLSIENRSRDEYIYIQAGDIVKGGKQDRVFSNDMVLVPGSGKQDIAAFCVESGRWQPRNDEPAREFRSSSKRLASKELRIAARLKNSQADVWREVDKVQHKLSNNLGVDVKSRTSKSSLQLALENTHLADRQAIYLQAFRDLPVHDSSVIGYAYAINGRLNSADIYASHALLGKLWPKIIDAATAESIANQGKTEKFKSPGSREVKQWLLRTASGHKSVRKLNADLTQVTTDSDTEVRFETYFGVKGKKQLYRQSLISK